MVELYDWGLADGSDRFVRVLGVGWAGETPRASQGSGQRDWNPSILRNTKLDKLFWSGENEKHEVHIESYRGPALAENTLPKRRRARSAGNKLKEILYIQPQIPISAINILL